MPPKKKAATTTSSSNNSLEGLVLVLSGTLSTTKAAFTTLVEDNGGTVATSVTAKATHLITTPEDFANETAKVLSARKRGIFIVSEDFVQESIKAGKKANEADYALDKSQPEKKRAAKEESSDDEESEEEEEKPKKKATKKTTKKSKKEEKEEEEEKPRRSARSKKAPAKTEDSSSSSSDEEEEEPKKPEPKKEEKKEAEQKVTVTVKGRAAVDTHSGRSKDSHVLEEGDCVYDAMLNQTNIAQNNNKFYVIQVLESDDKKQWWCWNRWGRVGERGQFKLQGCPSKARAVAEFEKKFHDKTKNRWSDRDSFQSKPGLYTLIKIDYGAEGAEEADAEKAAEKKAANEKKTRERSSRGSALDPRLQDFIKLIFDLKMMESVMMEMEFDVKKMPLGKLTKQQIKDGYQVLKDIEALLNNNTKGAKAEITNLSSRFYTLIPHSFPRHIVPPSIDTSEKLKQKMAMLQALADIEIATKLLKESDESDDTSNPIDAHYKSLKCDLVPLDNDSDEYRMIHQYVRNTHQGKVPVIRSCLKVNRQGEFDRYEKGGKGLGNRMLLWHGSRLTNFVGILSQGLRIAPPEAPASGYRFGKGIYLADIMSLSSKYCRSGNSNDFCMLLCDAALGKPAELPRDQYMEKPLPGSHSTKALGTIEPNPKENLVMPDGMVVPYGKIVPSGHNNVSCLEHQYIVYDVAQCTLNYVLWLNWEQK